MAKFILRSKAKTPVVVIPPRPQAPLPVVEPTKSTVLESQFVVTSSVTDESVAKLVSALPSLQQIPRAGEAAELVKKVFVPLDDGLPKNPVKASVTPTAIVLPSLPAPVIPTPPTIKFEHADKLYRYVYQRSTPAKAGKLKLNIAASRMAEFRSSPTGRRLEQLVDILQQSGSWYEITSQDFENWKELTSTEHDGIKPWLLAFNAFFNRTVNANPLPAVTPVKKEIRKVVIAGNGKLVVSHPAANAERLAKLAARFRRPGS